MGDGVITAMKPYKFIPHFTLSDYFPQSLLRGARNGKPVDIFAAENTLSDQELFQISVKARRGLSGVCTEPW